MSYHICLTWYNRWLSQVNDHSPTGIYYDISLSTCPHYNTYDRSSERMNIHNRAWFSHKLYQNSSFSSWWSIDVYKRPIWFPIHATHTWSTRIYHILGNLVDIQYNTIDSKDESVKNTGFIFCVSIFHRMAWTGFVILYRITL